MDQQPDQHRRRAAALQAGGACEHQRPQQAAGMDERPVAALPAGQRPVRRHAVGTSHPPLVRRPDGSVDIIFSQDRPDDPHVNWLPVPPARFDVYLRIYVPAPNVLNGAWRPPAIERLRG